MLRYGSSCACSSVQTCLSKFYVLLLLLQASTRSAGPDLAFLVCSQWGHVEDEASESMTPRKPAALSTQGGLLLRPQSNLGTMLVLLSVLSFAQLLVLAVLGGGLTVTRNVLNRVDIAVEGVCLFTAFVLRALQRPRQTSFQLVLPHVCFKPHMVAFAGLDLSQLQAVPPAPVDWGVTLAGHGLVHQEEEVDGLHTDVLSFGSELYNR